MMMSHGAAIRAGKQASVNQQNLEKHRLPEMEDLPPPPDIIPNKAISIFQAGEEIEENKDVVEEDVKKTSECINKIKKAWRYEWPSSKYSFHGKEIEVDKKVFFFLDGDWKFRQWIVWLVEWKWFENFITLIIMANSVMLAVQDNGDRLHGENYISIRNLNMGVVDDAFTIIFIAELLLKILARGFMLHKNAYCRDAWSYLDMLVVIVSVIGWIPNVGD